MLMHDNRPRLRTATIVHVLLALVVVGGVAGFSESLTKPTEEGKVTFLRKEANAWEVWIAKADGSDLRRLTSDGLGKSPPLWSPNGTKIVYSHGVGSGKEPMAEIVIITAEGKQVQSIPIFSGNLINALEGI